MLPLIAKNLTIFGIGLESVGVVTVVLFDYPTVPPLNQLQTDRYFVCFGGVINTKKVRDK